MSETGEGNPAGNFKKTVIAQQERTKSVENTYELSDELRGEHTFAKFFSLYKAGEGGSVNSTIYSGNAVLDQIWKFDKDGKLASVQVKKSLMNGEIISDELLRRDENGKFQVNESKSSNPGDWEKEFNTAKSRIQANRNIPSRTKAPTASK